MKKLALQILAVVPDDLAAFHALAKVSILEQDFTMLRLLVMAGNYAELDHERYDYISIIELRNIFNNYYLMFLINRLYVKEINKK